MVFSSSACAKSVSSSDSRQVRGLQNDERAMSVNPQEAKRVVALSDEALLLECEEEFFIASGPGGQHRNKTETGVRLTHKPTGMTVTATERRSQLQNRGAALERMKAMFVKYSYVQPKRVATKSTSSA
jgi:protein subunit release factor B